MHFIKVIVTLLIGLTLASHPHVVTEGDLADDEEKSTDAGSLGQGSRDGHHKTMRNGNDDGGRLVQEDLELNGTYGNERNKIKRSGDRHYERTKSDKKGKNPNKEGGVKRRDKKRFKPTQSRPSLRALDRTGSCPCNNWIPNWDNYTELPIIENGTVVANLCSRDQSEYVTDIIAYMIGVNKTASVKAIVNPSVDCNASFHGMQDGVYMIRAEAICPGFTYKLYGEEKVCTSRSKFSNIILARAVPKPINPNQQSIIESPDSTTIVAVGGVSGLALVIIVVAVICVVVVHWKKRRTSSKPYANDDVQRCVNIPLEPINQSDSSRLSRSSWITLENDDGASYQNSPSAGENSRQLEPECRPPICQLSPLNGAVTSYQQSSRTCSVTSSQNLLNGFLPDSTRILSEEPQITTPRGSVSHSLMDPYFSGIVCIPKSDALKWSEVPLPACLFPPKRTYVKKSRISELLKSDESSFEDNENDTVKGPLCDTENELVSDTENEAVSDTETEICLMQKKNSNKKT